MKLIIDIPEETYNDIQSRDWKNGELIFSEEWKAIHNGTPIPDNATNGDVIMAMFPRAGIHPDGNDVFFHHMGFWIECNIRWWNAPYQKGGK